MPVPRRAGAAAHGIRKPALVHERQVCSHARLAWTLDAVMCWFRLCFCFALSSCTLLLKGLLSSCRSRAPLSQVWLRSVFLFYLPRAFVPLEIGQTAPHYDGVARGHAGKYRRCMHACVPKKSRRTLCHDKEFLGSVSHWRLCAFMERIRKVTRLIFPTPHSQLAVSDNNAIAVITSTNAVYVATSPSDPLLRVCSEPFVVTLLPVLAGPRSFSCINRFCLLSESMELISIGVRGDEI